ncbi:MAG TPA: triose-phosphate isomerase [Candidatus Kapabacteria bacterium]|nr:triose-phosphate isomerase [Candidatus Kapabacteria bacterium]
MRRKFICGNWKMHGTLEETSTLVAGIIGRWDDSYKNAEIAICPPFTSLALAQSLLSSRGVRIALGAQNCHYESKGAFTGEVSARMLVEAGCTYVIVGHSERRAYFGETNELINKKLIVALAAGLKPILCIGETHDERELQRTFEVVLEQLRGGLRDVTPLQMHQVTIAYEPVWAIGTGKTATPEIAQDAHSFIRMQLAKLFDEETANRICIQYGGSMNAKNAEALFAQPDIDGGLIGGASLDAEAFMAIVRNASMQK